MEQSARMWQPWAQPGQTGQVTIQQLQQLLQMMEQSMPAIEVLHGLHVEALKDAQVKAHPAMERFSDQGMENLHAMVAAAGIIRRIAGGERTEALLTLLKEQLGVAVSTHRGAKTALAQLMDDARVRDNRALQSLNQVFGLVDQQVNAMRPLLSLLVPAEVFTGEH